jgi:5-methylcytosine-specific restriction endonuclease McrA
VWSDLNCPKCDSQFDSEQGLRTHYGICHDGKLPNSSCNACGSSYHSRGSRKKYCDECSPFVGERNPNYKSAEQSTTCECCGDTFTYYPSSKKGRYCNSCQESRPWVTEKTLQNRKDPEHYGNKDTIECDWCSLEFERYKSEINSGENFCSSECKNRWLSKEYEGEGHPRWEPDYPTRYGEGWYRVKRQALERDNYECQDCGKTREEIGRNPDVHHMKPVRSFDEESDAHYLENVISVCVQCHKDRERKL